MVLRIKYNEFQEYNEMQEKKPQQRQGHGAGQAVFFGSNLTPRPAGFAKNCST